ncbi:hypothetical protein UY3_17702 [Chelonia mydas]|uniref:Uncharacterized protein n=1 Tax=Chelonia mydas TaxID=8469 RepID=M7AJG9_CHEMY|nr:hypothetical protein UY3_17702 [Chelonia mydas]
MDSAVRLHATLTQRKDRACPETPQSPAPPCQVHQSLQCENSEVEGRREDSGALTGTTTSKNLSYCTGINCEADAICVSAPIQNAIKSECYRERHFVFSLPQKFYICSLFELLVLLGIATL